MLDSTNVGFVTPKAAKTTRSVKSMLRLTTIIREPGEKIGMTIHAGSKGVQVLALDPNGPSARTGTIHALDMIVEINGKPTYGLSPSDVTKWIKELGNKSFTVRTYRSSSLITPHTTPQSTNSHVTPVVHSTPHSSVGSRQGRRLVFSPDGKTSSYETYQHHSTSDNHSGIVMQPLNPTDMSSPPSSPLPYRRSCSPVIFGEDDDLDEFKQLEKSLVGSGSSRKLLSKSKSVTQPETDSHFAQIRHLAKTDYSQYSRVVLNQDQSPNSTPTGTNSKPTSPNRPRSFPHITSTFEQFRLDTDNDVSKWIQRYEPKAEARRCGPCQSDATEHSTNTTNTSLLVPPSPCRPRSGSISRRSSSIPISRSRSDSLTKAKALSLSAHQPANTSSDVGVGGADGTTTSFQLFKYKVLLTQLDAARARRADGMDDLESTRVEICTFIEKLFGQSSDEVTQLSAASSAADFLCDSPSTSFDQGICESSIPLPNHRGGTSKDLDLGTKHSADILCKAVLLQLSHVEKARTKSARAKDDLNLLRRKALITARGVRARVVRLWARGSGDNLGLSLSQGVCHTSRGVTISAISPESPASTCGSVFAGDVILKINHKCMLSCTKTEVNSMLSCPSGYLTIVLAPSAELDAAFALRWYAGDSANCCQHEIATNRWLYQQTPAISRKALEEIDRNNVLQLQQQHVGDTTPRHQLPAPETVSGSWDLKSQPSASHLNMDRATFFPPRDTATVTSDVEAQLNGTSTKSNSQQLESLLTKVPSQTKTDAMTKMLDTIGISTLPTSSTTSPHPSADGEAVQYPWQNSPTPIESMEQRRRDLLEMDISENDALMNEWMMLLRVRATVQNGQESEHASPSNEIQKPSMRSRFASLIGNFTAKSKAFAAKRIQSISETSEIDLTDDNTSSSSSVTITLDDDVLAPIKNVDYVNPSDDDLFSRTYNQPKGLRVDSFGNWEPPTIDDNVSDCDSAHNYSLDADSCTTTSDIADLAIEPVLSTTQLQEIEARARRRAIATRKVLLRQQQLQKAAKQAQETPIAGLQRKGSSGKKSKEVLAKDFSRRMAMMKTLKDSLNGNGVELVPDVQEQPALCV
eukprot:m.261185 g.261185  ORF g.261185 m.261185 type:complete len:1090 (+) comp41540_c0_seq1:523-3792(+)